MIFADKLIQLRKKSGWSQEELAEQMNVSRQSVSKWEGAQSMPDLEKMIKLSKLFGVSTDYLLRDDFEELEVIEVSEEHDSNLRYVSMEEANTFLELKAMTSKSIAYATALCILSPICLLILGVMSEIPKFHVSENVAGGVGMIILLVLISIAVALFISSGSKTSDFEYLEKEIFETEYGVTGMVKEKKEQFRETYTRNNIIGASLCIISVIPLFGGIIIGGENDLLIILMISVMLVLIAIGVFFFIRGGVIWESFAKLLQEGEYSKQEKAYHTIITAISTIYWLLATAIYLAYSFATNKWETSWIVWPVAGVLYPAIIAIVKLTQKHDK